MSTGTQQQELNNINVPFRLYGSVSLEGEISTPTISPRIRALHCLRNVSYSTNFLNVRSPGEIGGQLINKSEIFLLSLESPKKPETQS